jgi:hypothetical protein
METYRAEAWAALGVAGDASLPELTQQRITNGNLHQAKQS